MSSRLALSLAAPALLAGCGSLSAGELPPPAGPPRPPVATLHGGRTIAVVEPRERVLELRDARTNRRLVRAPAGVGPTRVVCRDRGPCYVLDTRGDGLLVFRVGTGTLRLVRRVYLPGGPSDIVLDERRARLRVTLPGRKEIVLLPAHGRPHVLARRPITLTK